jgi:uncharacterized protein YdhG (YjbR/CyaY superfamily)
MAKAQRTKSVDDYIKGFPPATQRVLSRLRGTIRKALPGSDEAISYGIPVFKLDGRYVLYFAAWKAHYSVYPATDRLAARFAKELAPYELSGKGTVRFPLDEPIPSRLIAGIAKFRMKEAAERRSTPSAAKKR